METKIFILLLACLTLSATELMAQNTATIKGRVTTAEKEQPLMGASVFLIGTSQGTATDANGEYIITGIEPGKYKLRVMYLGYKHFTSKLLDISAGETVTVNITLEHTTFAGNKIVVTGTRRPEKLLKSAVTIDKISDVAIERTAGTTFMSSLSTMTGVNVTHAGINTTLVSARGFNSSFNTSMLFLIDGRLATLGSTGLPQGNFLPTSGIDIKSVEVVLGPAAALYGPNATSGVVNVITKDPWDQSGITVAVRGGSRSLRGINYRIAGTLNNRFGYKITGQYFKAKDFKPQRSDSLHFYQAAGTKPTPANTVFETDVVENYDVGSTKFTGALYYHIGGWKISGTYGWSSTDQFALTSNGRNRIRNWKVNYQTLQASNAHWYAQISRNGNTAGSFQLNQVVRYVQGLVYKGKTLDQINLEAIREAFGFVDDTKIYDGEVQYNNKFGRVNLVTGLQYRLYLPYSGGTYLRDGHGQDINRTLFGGYAQVDFDIIKNTLRLVAAARLDHNSDYELQFSPKAALVATVAPGQNLRFTFNRAYKSPTILQSHAYIPGKIPSKKFPKYYSLLAGNTNGYTIKDPSGNVVTRIPATEPQEVTAVELGYKGAFGKKLYINMVGYYSWYKNFIGASIVAKGFKTIAYQNGKKVLPPGANHTLLLTFINFGQARVGGFDVGINYYISNHYKVSGSFSTIKLFDFTNDVNSTKLPLNTPPISWKAGFTASNFFDSATITDPFIKLTSRWQSSYEYISGYWNSDVLLDDDGNIHNKEELPPKFVMNASAGFGISNTGLEIQASVSNIFDTQKVDMLGVPPMGRVFWVQVKYNFTGLRF